MAQNIEIQSKTMKEMETVLTPEALAFVEKLQRQFGGRVEDLLRARAARQAQRKQGGIKLDFLPETKAIREGDWTVAPIPKDLQDRRVEITGPVDRKMIINALNSGAKCFLADFEDALTPGWEQVVQGQQNLTDAINGSISFTSPEGKEYKLRAAYPSPELAILIIRPRGWHLQEKHLLIDSKPVVGALMDFGLYFFHNAKTLVAKGTGPYFYLPKLEGHKEAALWSDIFHFAEKELGLPTPTIKATVLIETIPAAFEMDEILYALKEHIVAQNAGRWDYIFSYIKYHAYDPAFVTPERHKVTMTQPFLRSYSQLLIKTCHRRGAMAMGGMSAFIPIKGDEEANAKAFAGVKADKEREAGDGHDGTWVAHPGLIPVAKAVFDEKMPKANQVDKLREDVQATAADLLRVPEGPITEAGVRNNISVALQYIAAWIGGTGCVPIFNLMEDAATAEISRTQLWQWIYHKAKVEGGTVFTPELYKKLHSEEYDRIVSSYAGVYDPQCLKQASEVLDKLVLADELAEFLTLPAYELLG